MDRLIVWLLRPFVKAAARLVAIYHAERAAQKIPRRILSVGEM
jgi:hypothetical protein